MALDVLSGSTNVGTTFYYDEFDVSTDGRYRSSLGVAYTPVLPLPPALLLLASGLGSVFFLGHILRFPSRFTLRRSSLLKGSFMGSGGDRLSSATNWGLYLTPNR
jgi:hypothetical protein